MKNINIENWTEIEAHKAYQKALLNINLYKNNNAEFRSLLNDLP